MRSASAFLDQRRDDQNMTMHDIKSNLHPCAHCEGSGTCRNGEQRLSCAECIKESELKGKSFAGLPCMVCGGIGQAEPKTERINKRIPALVGFIVVFMLLGGVLICGVLQSRYFSEVLAFAGPLIGSVLAYYYSAQRHLTN
ncbi:TPA: molecular chaperone DnaJ [Pseudomonas aeruginosa]|nr:molecular chaperone DnaJ [Pseudomonas aeruginosa]HBP4855631.1 molecular chaperone DnaJ [Pseudomonas aeruginosa]